MNSMKIITFEPFFAEQIKDLLVQLQNHLIELDKEDVLILRDNYRDDYYNFVMNNLKEKSGIMYLTVENQKVIGLVSGFVGQLDEEDQLVNTCSIRGYISEFVVDKKFRGHQVGTQLMETIEKWFKNNKCDFIRIDVLAQNEDALYFYEKKGYKSISIEVSKRI